MARRMAFGRYDVAVFGGFATYAACSLVVPVALVPMARELGFPLAAGGMSAGGALPAGRTAGIVLSMLGCGFLAGRWGLRAPLGVALGVLATAMLAAGLAPAYAAVFLALTVAGLAEGVIEALATPAIQRLHPAEPGRYINFSHAFWSVGVLVSVLAVGWLLSAGVSWRWLLGGAGAVGLLPATIFLLPGRNSRRTAIDLHEAVPWRQTVAHAAAILRRRRFWLFFVAMLFAGGGEMALTFWSASFIQLQFSAEPRAGGVGTACFAAGMMAGRLGWGYLVVQHRLRRLIVGSAIAAAAVSLPLTWAPSLGWTFALLALAGVGVGPFWPSIQSYAADRLPVDTTMLFILLSCAGVPGCGLATWLVGAAGDAIGLRAAFLIVPACFLAIAGLMALDRTPAKR